MPAPSWLRTQLSGPSGWLARPMARLLNRGNRPEYTAAIRHLPLEAGEVVLELGFGGGIGLQLLLDRGATVVGVEPAVAMRARAYRKHAWALADGRLRIEEGSAEALPDGPFDHALSMNTVYFWSDVERAMAELRRTVRNTVILGVAPASHLRDMGFEESGFRIEEPAWYAERLREAGFDTRQVTAGAVGATIVIGHSTSSPSR